MSTEAQGATGFLEGSGGEASGRPLLGTVVAFDHDRGVGVIEADDGASVSFHCTTLMDGSREVDEGARVCFLVGPTHGGVYEAYGVVKLDR